MCVDERGLEVQEEIVLYCAVLYINVVQDVMRACFGGFGFLVPKSIAHGKKSCVHY